MSNQTKATNQYPALIEYTDQTCRECGHSGAKVMYANVHGVVCKPCWDKGASE